MSFCAGAKIGCTGATAYNAPRKLAPSGRDTLALFGLGPLRSQLYRWERRWG